MREDPIDLSALEIDDVDVVRHAVLRFRRRVLVRSAWVVLLLLAVAAIVGRRVEQQNGNFRGQIFEGGSWNGVIATYQVGVATVQVQKVTVIPGHRLGLVLLYAPARLSGKPVVLAPGFASIPCGSLAPSVCVSYGDPRQSFSQSSEGCAAFCEVYLAIPIPSGRDIPMSLLIGRSTTIPFTIDLDDLDVPSLEGR